MVGGGNVLTVARRWEVWGSGCRGYLGGCWTMDSVGRDNDSCILRLLCIYFAW